MSTSNTEDVIDSRDVIARLDELQSMDENDEVFDRDELTALLKLSEQAQGSPDWLHGETLIRDSYFEEYARELAEDIGVIKGDEQWPLGFIDWERAADALKQDYFSVDYEGVEYWIRA